MVKDGKADSKGSVLPAAKVRTGNRSGQAGDYGSDGYTKNK
jgi:hypothetical protein